MTAEQINQFFSFLYEGYVGEVVFWLRLAAGVLISAMAAAIVVIFIKFRQLFSDVARPAEPRDVTEAAETASRQWVQVKQKIDSASSSDWNLAVIQADSIFDSVLQGMGLAGATMGDRLRGLDRSKLASLDDVWQAHKMRNRIAHDTDRVLSQAEAKLAVGLFEKALRELSYLQ